MSNSYKIGQQLDSEDKELFYRGTIYHFNAENKIWWRPNKEAAQGGLKATVTSNHSKILGRLRKLKPEGGSFRVTENNIVLTKMNRKEDQWEPVFVGVLDEPFEFKEDINTNPEDLEPGDLWPSFYDGSKFSAVRTTKTKIWFKKPVELRESKSGSFYTPRQYIKNTMPKDIEKEFTYYKGQGGSFRITENGHVITLITPQPLSDRLKKQWDNFSDIQQRLIEVKVEGTQMLPIYLGLWKSPSIEIDPTKDYASKLNDNEKKKMLDFLSKFAPNPSSEEEDEIKVETEVYWDDPEDFYGEED